jgi:iron complex transport system permease protein
MQSTEHEAYENVDIRANSKPVAGVTVLTLGTMALLLSIGLSISFGAADIDLLTVWSAVFSFSGDLTAHQIIQEIRLPRVLGAAIIGACFAVAGAIMQGMTRNPLADSGLLGLNAGAAFMVAVSLAFFPGLSYKYLMLFAFVGAAIGTVLVFGIGSMSRAGLTPMRLVLAGAAVSALLSSLSQGIAVHFDLAQDLAFWYAGDVSGTTWANLKSMLPWVVISFIGALFLSRSITLLSLGDEVAIGLGKRPGLIKLAGSILVLILAGIAVSVVGAVSFVGLMIPHITRFLVGHDYRWIIPNSIVIGSLFMVLADLCARMVNPPSETPIGALIALIGVPFFLYLARKGGRGF